MIIRPCSSTSAQTSSEGVSAWDAVARAQRATADAYLLIRQPDHARLAGELVQHLVLDGLDEGIVAGICVHDDGWAEFDDGTETLSATPALYVAPGYALNAWGKPISFLEIKPADFLRAWTASIEAAAVIAPMAALIVSGHFVRLGQVGLKAGNYDDDDAEQVRHFIAAEEQRRSQLGSREKRDACHIEYWTDVLQFCDLLSLYLCCGSQQPVEFPQDLLRSGKRIRISLKDGVFATSPSLFRREHEFSLTAYQFPSDKTVAQPLEWRLR